MKDYRLDFVDWYDKEKDLLQCLVCQRWFKRVSTLHLRKHGFQSDQEYKEFYQILPRTPLKNKKLLQSNSRHAFEQIASGELKPVEKGRNPIPKSKRQKKDGFGKQKYTEFSRIVSKSSKGRKSFIAGKTYDTHYGVEKADEIKRKLSDAGYRRYKRESGNKE